MSSGIWRYRVIVTHNGVQKITPFKFQVISESANQGYVKVAANNKNFEFINADFKIHVWEYDNNCNPQPFPIKTMDTIVEASLESAETVRMEAKKVSVFPNPFSSKLNITGLSPQDGVVIYDILGSIVYRSSGINDATSLIETIFWSPGMYLVCVKDIEGRDIGTYKIVK